MYVNPSLVMFAVWIVPWTVPMLLSSNLFLPLSSELKLSIFSMFLAVLLFSFLLNLSARTSHGRFVAAIRDDIDIAAVYRLAKRLTGVWLAIYFLTIVYSGGVPLIWVLIGDGRTYVDFGLPTVSGFANMLRALALSLATLVVLCARWNGVKAPRRAWVIILMMLISAFIIETGRGNGVVLALHPVAYLFLLMRVSLRNVVGVLVLFIGFIVAMSLIQVLRYGASLAYLLEYADNQGFQDVPFTLALLVPFFSYIYLPLVNLDINLPYLPDLAFQMNYSVQGFFPTVVRGHIFGQEKDYGTLISEANNVTSFITPLVRDFGVFGGFIVGTFMLCLTQYSYFRCRQGSVRHVLIFPPLFMSLTLSFFSLFYTLQVVVLYLVIGIFLVKPVLKKPISEPKSESVHV